ncbi:hypothetical protein phiK7A1_095 [Pseudomonas phage phiK7A1]|uniref:Uncharacterized protein n=1 Tax=Pseudomonas phage phiK7A1 TaxID=2759194 RepID=A0A7H0XFU3_9CAUD|nr:hypothetical protein phiK7A1_095 [Pseudomonas phage phiK7A1]
MAATVPTSDMAGKVVTLVLSTLLTMVMAWAGYQQAAINKLDQRVYELQATAVTEGKMAAMEQRITSYVDKSVQSLSANQAVTNKYLEILTERSYKPK